MAYYSKLLMAKNFSLSSSSSQYCLQLHCTYPTSSFAPSSLGSFLLLAALIMCVHLSATSLRSNLHNTSHGGASSRAAAKNRPTTAYVDGGGGRWGKTFAGETIYFTFKLRNVSTFSSFWQMQMPETLSSFAFPSASPSPSPSPFSTPSSSRLSAPSSRPDLPSRPPSCIYARDLLPALA